MSRRKNYKRYSRTDSGNAELFATLYNGKVLFDHKQQRWLIWDTSKFRWTEDKTGHVREFAKKSAAYRLKKLMPNLPSGSEEERNEQNREAKWAIESQSLYRIKATLELAESVPLIADDGEGWDTDSWLFGVANGVVDLRTGKLRRATQQDRITKFSPVAFDPAAKCLRFEHFVSEIFGGDTDLIRYVQKAGGYSLTGSIQEQCLFACYGPGGNGKTTWLEILLHVEGDYGLDLPFSALEVNRNGNAMGEGVNLPGARFAKSVEIREGKQLDEARVKALTGGDTISVRPLFHNSFSFKPTHKLWLAFNHKPVIADDSPAMWRRIRLIPFLHKFEGAQADKGLLEKLKAEAPGILNWLIEGCLTWRREGLEVPVSIERATREYERESDPLAPFFEDCCEQDSIYTVPKGELWSAYQTWCAANKERPVSRNGFAEKLKSRGFSDGNTGSVRYWRGLRLRPADTTDTTEGSFQHSSIEQSPIGKSWKGGQVASVASDTGTPECLPPLAGCAEVPEDNP